MDRRRAVWHGAMAVAVGMALCGAAQHAEAQSAGHGRQWQPAERAVRAGHLGAPETVLQVDFSYDAEAAPALAIAGLRLKRGYAPSYEELDSGHVLSVLGESGETLVSVAFRVPNVVYPAPPLPGETHGDAGVTLKKVRFSLTVPMPEDAAALVVTDPQGQEVAREDLRDVPIRFVPPSFHTLPAGRQSKAETGTDGEVGDRHQFRSLRSWAKLVPVPQPQKEGLSPVWPLMRIFDFLMMTETAEAAANNGVLDVTFVGDDYTAADLTQYAQDVDRVVAHMLAYEPYATRTSQVVFHRVDNVVEDLGCYHYPTMDRLIVCDNTAVISAVTDAGAPYDKIVVLVKDSTYGGSGGAVAVSYNGGYAGEVVTHEFGHTFGGLLDEYELYASSGPLDGAAHMNCYAGAPPASEWDDLVSGSDYALGCNYPNWYRSSSCSVMRNISCRYFNAVSQSELSVKLDQYASLPAPDLVLSADPALVALGSSSVLTWTGSHLTACAASGAWTGVKPVSGSEQVAPGADASYTLDCMNGTDVVTRSAIVEVDAQAPMVSLSEPSEGSVVAGRVTVAADATDDRGVARVDFFADGALLGSDNTAPYSLEWDTTNAADGAHELSARAGDLAGNSAPSSGVTVTVENSTTTSTKPGKGNSGGGGGGGKKKK